MSILQLEKSACVSCGNGENAFAEFNDRLLCPQCFRNEIESRVKLVS